MTTLRRLWDNVYLRLLFIVAALTLIGYFFLTTREVWISFVVAYLIAYLLNPIVSRIARRFSRVVGMLSIVLGLLVLVGLLWLLGIQMAAQFSTFALKLPGLIATFQELPFRVGRWVDPNFGAIFQQIYINLERLSFYVTQRLIPQATSVNTSGSNPTQTLLTLAGGSAQVGIIFVLTLYLLYNFPGYSRSFLRVFPHRHRPIVEEVVTVAGESVGSYVRGQIVIAFLVGIMTFIGFIIVGVPLATALAVLAGLLNLVPFLGPILTAIPTVLLAMTEGSGTVLGAIIVLVAVNQIDGHILTPMVFSRVISLDPVTVIVAILVGAALFGFVGALLAVPVAAFLKVMYTSYYIEGEWYKQAA